jgi:hypothetical protein
LLVSPEGTVDPWTVVPGCTQPFDQRRRILREDLVVADDPQRAAQTDAVQVIWQTVERSVRDDHVVCASGGGDTEWSVVQFRLS